MPSSDEFNRNMRILLCKYAMEGKWGDAVNHCSRYPLLFRETITRHGNTVLHLAVSDCQEGVVRQLVGIIESRFDADGAVDVLSTRNEEGNTPLHLAVLVGKVEMCKCICDGRRPQLVAARNKEGETPLFLAARIGEMDAFTCLLRLDTQNILANMRNASSDTVLHCAISGEHYKLAFLILQRFPELGNSVNEEGMTPLHLLAEKPGAFRSGTYLSLFDRFIYHLIISFSGDDGDRISPTEARGVFSGLKGITWLKGRTWSKGQNYIQRITKKKERNFFSIRIMHRLLDYQSYQPYEYENVINPFVEDMEMKEERELYGCLPDVDIPEAKRDEGASQYNEKGKETMEEGDLSLLQIQKGRHLIKLIDFVNCLEFTIFKNPEELISANLQSTARAEKCFNLSILFMTGSNWAVVFKLDKDGPRPDVLIVRGVDGDPADAVTKARAAAANLDDKLRRNKAQEKNRVGRSGQTPILLAAKNGITEMVKKILETSPVSIHDEDMDKKNTVLLAVENRQPTVYKLLLRKYGRESSLFRAVDKDGCSALHLAAKFSHKRPSFILGSALEMQQEVLWYEYVKASMPRDFFPRRNNMNEAANEIFMKDHKELMEKGKQWVKETATACSVVGTFIATMAFTASTTTTGGGNKEGGGSGNHSTLEQQEAALTVFAVSSYITLSFSISSVIMFLATFISRNNVSDFARDLPVKLLLGLTCLFSSILSMLVTSCAGPFFLPKDVIRIPGLVVFAITSLPATYFAAAQLPLYIELIWATFRAVPRRWVEEAWW